MTWADGKPAKKQRNSDALCHEPARHTSGRYFAVLSPGKCNINTIQAAGAVAKISAGSDR